MGEVTVLTKAGPITKSLRVTVPGSIVKVLGLEEGDEFDWNLVAEGNKLSIDIKVIKKVRTEA